MKNEVTKIFTMAGVVWILAWFLLPTQNKKMAMIFNSSTPTMIIPTTAPAFELTSDVFEDNVPINAGTELTSFTA